MALWDCNSHGLVFQCANVMIFIGTYKKNIYHKFYGLICRVDRSRNRALGDVYGNLSAYVVSVL